jgi:hypothetical protein
MILGAAKLVAVYKAGQLSGSLAYFWMFLRNLTTADTLQIRPGF